MTAELYWMADCWGNGDTYAKVLQKGIKRETGMQYDIGSGVPGKKRPARLYLELDGDKGKSQQYVLRVTRRRKSPSRAETDQRALRCADAVPDDASNTVHTRFLPCGSRMTRICRCAAIISMRREAVC